jgi:hypothetical protein
MQKWGMWSEFTSKGAIYRQLGVTDSNHTVQVLCAGNVVQEGAGAGRGGTHGFVAARAVLVNLHPKVAHATQGGVTPAWYLLQCEAAARGG